MLNKFFEGMTFDDFLLIPRLGVVRSRAEVTLDTRFTETIPLKFPVVSANMDTITGLDMAGAVASFGGLGVIHRGCPITDQTYAVSVLSNRRCFSAAAVGVSGDYLERAEALINSGVHAIVVDIAHGHSVMMREAIELLNDRVGVCALVAGNVATPEGALFLAHLGVDAIKVGIGAGSACRTRLETGVGVPQLEAIVSIYEALRDNGFDIPIIADGGIRNDKDIFLSLAAGASSVMLGGMLAGTDETPEPYRADGLGGLQKRFRGMASASAQMERGEFRQAAEGLELRVPLKGPVVNVLTRIQGHLQSAISYMGCKSLQEIHEQITPELDWHLTPLSSATRRESFSR